MTSIEQAVFCLHIAINALVLWFVWHVAWRRSCQERFRQRLFEVRDELFDFARQGGIAFTDPAYVALRSHINGMIRFSHRISVTRLAAFVLLRRYIGDLPQPYPSLSSSLAQVKGRKAKETLTAINGKVAYHIWKFLIFSSPHILIAGPALYLLDQWINEKPAARLKSSSQPPIVSMIELQAREAYRSEAVKRCHENELVSAMS
ncbi:MAG: hypothetical protein WB992_17875 [Bryobacteraceae bacterium]